MDACCNTSWADDDECEAARRSKAGEMIDTCSSRTELQTEYFSLADDFESDTSRPANATPLGTPKAVCARVDKAHRSTSMGGCGGTPRGLARRFSFGNRDSSGGGIAVHAALVLLGFGLALVALRFSASGDTNINHQLERLRDEVRALKDVAVAVTPVPTAAQKAVAGGSLSMGAVAPVVKGNPKCWQGGFSWEFCCHHGHGPLGNSKCWDSHHNHKVCCG